MIKVSDYIFQFIARLGVRHVFMLPGGGAMHLVDSLGRTPGLEYVACLHEQAAVIAAEADAQYRGHIGVALVTTGPGGTNALTGVASAWIDSVPLMVISGQAKRADMIGSRGLRQGGIQEVDIVAIVKPVTKYAVTVMEPLRIRYHLEKALHLALSGRCGPVWIDVPLDVQGAVVDEMLLEGFSPAEPGPGQTGGGDIARQVKDLAGLLNEAQRPVILAGNGIRQSGGLEDFLKWAEFLQVPVLTTWKAIDFLPEEHPLFFGRPGAVASRGANFVQQNSDLFISLGARLDLVQTGFDHANFARAARKVIVDIDPAEISKLKMRIDLAVCADLRGFLQECRGQERQFKKVDRSAWLARCRQWKEKYPVVLPEYARRSGSVNPYVLVDVLSDVLTGEDLLVPGSSGGCSEVTLQAFRVKKGQRIFNSPGLGSMGFGLPASMGACLASGRRRTVTLVGDGGLQHNIQELATVARLKLPLKIFVLNNNGYGSIRHTQNTHFQGRLVACDPSSGLGLADTRALSAAYGLAYECFSDHAGLKDRLAASLAVPGPSVLEVMVDPLVQTAPRLSSEVRPDGSIVSKPMEDLWPFLPREEFRANMIIEPLKEA